MMRNLPFVISLVAGLLWAVAFGFLGKVFGITSPAKFQQRRGLLRRLSFTQYACFYGALGWGIAMFVMSVGDDYLQGKLLGNVVAHSSPAWAALSLLWWMGAGCLLGWMVGSIPQRGIITIKRPPNGTVGETSPLHSQPCPVGVLSVIA